MAKEKTAEEMKITNLEQAKFIKGEAEKTIEKSKKGILLAGIATGLTILGFLGLYSGVRFLQVAGDFMALCAPVLAIVSYVIAGGFGKALKTAFGIAKFGWLILPFPIDIITGMFSFVFALLAFLFLPIIMVWGNYNAAKKILADAEDYIAFNQGEIQE